MLPSGLSFCNLTAASKMFDTFDPLIDAVVIGRKPIKVKVELSPKFTLLGEEFGPFKSENIEFRCIDAFVFWHDDTDVMSHPMQGFG